MQITLEIPDEIADSLGSQLDKIPRRLLELFAAESYRKGTLGASQICRMLGFSSRRETYDFLKMTNFYVSPKLLQQRQDKHQV